jgi:hypothetical protein
MVTVNGERKFTEQGAESKKSEEMVGERAETQKAHDTAVGFLYKNSATTYSPAMKQYHRLSWA